MKSSAQAENKKTIPVIEQAFYFVMSIFAYVGYFFTPFGALGVMMLDLDPLYYIQNDMFITMPWVLAILKAVTVQSDILLILLCTLVRFCCLVFAMYEIERAVLFGTAFSYHTLKVMRDINNLISDFFALDLSKGETGRSLRNFLLHTYRIVLILFVNIENLIRVGCLASPLVGGMLIILCNYVLIKMHSQIGYPMTLAFVGLNVFSLISVKMGWEMCVNVHVAYSNLLGNFVSQDLILKILKLDRNEYLKAVKALRPILFPLGVWNYTLMSACRENKLGLLATVLDETITCIMTF